MNKKPVSEAHKRYTTKYIQQFDRIEIKAPKGQKELIKAHAMKFQDEIGEKGKAGHSPQGSVTAFLLRAISETMARDKESLRLKEIHDRTLKKAQEEGIIKPCEKRTSQQ
jgi:hypothetical protein